MTRSAATNVPKAGCSRPAIAIPRMAPRALNDCSQLMRWLHSLSGVNSTTNRLTVLEAPVPKPTRYAEISQAPNPCITVKPRKPAAISRKPLKKMAR
jgi:hypothetical protein